MDRPLKIAAIESCPIWADKNANLKQIEHEFDKIAEGTDLVILPEMWSTGFVIDKATATSLAERNTEETMRQLERLAHEHRFAIAGSQIAKTAGKLYNRAFLIEPSGETSYYDKQHLFRMGGETQTYSPGNSWGHIIRFRGWNLRLLICYDLRFPVWCRNIKSSPADLIIVVASWPKARENAWSLLLKARAIENLCYVCGVNRNGIDPEGIDYGRGSTAIIDFKGNVIAKGSLEGDGNQTICATLNAQELRNFRQKFPAWMDADDFCITTDLSSSECQ